MSAHVLLNSNELGKRDKMRGLPSILSIFLQQFLIMFQCLNTISYVPFTRVCCPLDRGVT